MPRRQPRHAVFDLTPGEVEGEMVRHRGATIFEAGEYKAKSYSMTPEELKAAAAAFKAPVPLELEHINSLGTATFLDGEYGTVENVAVSEDGKRLIGDIVLDPWVDRKWTKFIEKAGQKTRQVSAVWDRATKTLQKVGMVIRGHVPAAAFSAAFSDRDDDTKLEALFTARKRTPEDTRHLQGVHDHIAAMRPGVCKAAFGDKPKQTKAFGKIHDYAVEHGATCPGRAVKMSDSPTGDARKATDMDAKAKLIRAFFGEKSDAPELSITEEQAEAAYVAIQPKQPDPAALFADSPQAKAYEERIKALEAKNEEARREAAKNSAALFSEGLAREGRIEPVIKNDIASFLVDLSDDDHASPKVVTFADKAGVEAKGDRVDKLMSILSKLPATNRNVPQFDGTANFAEKYKLHLETGNSSGSHNLDDEIRRRNDAFFSSQGLAPATR